MLIIVSLDIYDPIMGYLRFGSYDFDEDDANEKAEKDKKILSESFKIDRLIIIRFKLEFFCEIIVQKIFCILTDLFQKFYDYKFYEKLSFWK